MKLCECGCGKPAPIAKNTDRRSGHVKGQPIRFIYGHNRGMLRHGAARRGKLTPEYRAYNTAKNRCTNPKYLDWRHYGGRGIKFLFTSFEQFLACLGSRPPGMTLDRINNDGHYEQGNCRWATRSQQEGNKRRLSDLENFTTEELESELRRRVRTL